MSAPLPPAPLDAARLLPALLDALPCAVALARAGDGVILARNRAWAGLPEAARLAELFPTLRLAPGESRHVLATGGGGEAASWWDVTLAPHPDLAGALLAVAREATGDELARRDAEAAREALAAAATRLRLAQEAARLGTWEWDIRRDLQAWSPEQFRLHGLDPGIPPPTGEAWFALVHPEDQPRLRQAAADGFHDAGGQYELEFRVRRGDTGNWRWLLAIGRVMERDAAGRPARIIGVNLDITERKMVETTLRASAHAAAERFRSLAETLPAMLFEMNADGGRAWSAESWSRYTGLPATALLGEGWRLAAHPEDLGQSRAALARAVEGVQDYVLRKRLRRHDGAWRWHLIRARAERCPESGRILRWFGVATDVHDLAEAEAARAAEATRAALALSAGGLVAWEIEAGGGRISGGEGLAGLFGVPQAELDGTMAPFIARLHEEDRDEVLAAFGDAVERMAPYRMEFRIRRGDGAIRRLIGVAQVLRGADGGRRVIGYNADITDRHAAEEARALSEARLKRVQRIGRVGGFEIDFTTGENRRSAEYMGLQGHAPRPASEGHADWLARLHPEDRARAEAHFLHAIAEGSGVTDYGQEYRIVTPAGETRWIAARAEIERDPATGRALRMLGAHLDITAVKQAEARLAESARRLRLALAAAALGTIEWDLAAGELLADGEASLVTRGLLPAGRVIGLASPERAAWRAAIHPQDLPRREAIRLGLQAPGGEESAQHEFRLRLPGMAAGDWAWMASRSTVVARDPATGAATRVLDLIQDITEIVAARQQSADLAQELERRVAERTRALSQAALELAAEMRRREEAQAALLQSQKMEALGQLTGGVAHDFNNLLAAVQGGYRLLARRVGGDPRAMALIEAGLKAAERGARLISQLMAFARKEELRPAVLDPGAVLRGAEDMVCHTAGSHVQCRFDVAPEVWPVIVDPVRLETVLLNLAANARDAMPQGGSLTVALRNARREEAPAGLPPGRDLVLLSVADTGNGMDEATLERATEPFFTTKPPGKGTGLGLASAHGFAAQSGGALRLRSQPGAGTVVELFLPRAGVLPGEASPPAEEAEAALLDTARHGGATLLVVDDDDGVRPVTAAVLRGLGYRVVEAPSAEAAEVMAHAEPGGIDMLVTDVVMGGAPGPVLAARLRAEMPALPVLYITAYPGSADLGADAVLRKPFREAALARAVLAGLGRLAAPPADRLNVRRPDRRP